MNKAELRRDITSVVHDLMDEMVTELGEELAGADGTFAKDLCAIDVDLLSTWVEAAVKNYLQKKLFGTLQFVQEGLRGEDEGGAFNDDGEKS